MRRARPGTLGILDSGRGVEEPCLGLWSGTPFAGSPPLDRRRVGSYTAYTGGWRYQIPGAPAVPAAMA
jgi:hypothetical protein